MTRHIILRKDIDNQNIEGYFITENEKETKIQHVTGNLITKTTKYDKKEIHAGLTADAFLGSLEGFRIKSDTTTEHKPTGFRVIDNLKNQVIGSYNW